MLKMMTDTGLTPNPEFTRLASEERIRRVAKALEANGIRTIVVENSEEAKERAMQLLPEGAQVYTNQSKTLSEIGLTAEIDDSGRFDAVRPKLSGLDRKTRGEEIRRLRSIPEYILGSVHAVTEDGRVLIASNGGSQLAPYSYGAARVIWVVGAQKIVKDLDEGFRRIEEYSYPLEDARLRSTLGVGSHIGKVLIVNQEVAPGRITLILVKQELGF